MTSFRRLASSRQTTLFQPPTHHSLSELRRGVSLLLALNVAGALLLEIQTRDATERILFGVLALVQYLHLTQRREPSTLWLIVATLSTVYTARYLGFWSLGVEVSVFAYIALAISHRRETVKPTKISGSEYRLFVAQWISLFLYALKALYSVTLHATDPYWRDGSVGTALLTSTFMSRFAELWQVIFAEASAVKLVISLLVAGFIPVFGSLVLFTVIGGAVARFCLRVSLLSFFIFSVVFLNLGILPFVEILLWRFWFSKRRKDIPTDGTEASTSAVTFDSVSKHNLPTSVRLARAVILLTATSYILSIPAVATIQPIPSEVTQSEAFKFARDIIGLAPINVFNTEDLQMSTRWIVVSEDEGTDGILTRLDGSRRWPQLLDSVYFGSTLGLRRNLIGKTETEACELARRYVNDRRFNQVAILMGRSAPKYYVTLFEKRLEQPTEDARVLCTFQSG